MFSKQPHGVSRSLAALAVLGLLAFPSLALAQYGALYEHEAIAYSATDPDNPVSRLQERIAAGEATLKHDDEFGWLESLLRELKIDESSQMLVFSKTSLQRRAISPRTPRALYFNDTTYIGYPNGGEIIEISVADPELGAVFYSLDQSNANRPIITRETDRCLVCHASSAHTDGIPGHIVRSVFTDERGFPELSLGSFQTTPESPVQERWGGWYVTGRVGENPHLGNQFVEPSEDVERYSPACEEHATWPSKVAEADYPGDTSDIAALLVLEHQVAVHNVLTRARFATERALWDERVLDEAFGESDDQLRDSTRGRIDRAATALVEQLFCLEAAPLAPGIVPDAEFVKQFAARGRRDSQGRSLRDFGLETRLFRYPCSFLVYGEAFRTLPRELKTIVVARMTAWLTNGIPERDAAMTAADRKAILEILRQTHPDFAKPADSDNSRDVSRRFRAPAVAPRPVSVRVEPLIRIAG